jgi:hypothetical protein
VLFYRQCHVFDIQSVAFASSREKVERYLSLCGMRDCLVVLDGFNGPGRIAGAHGEKPGSDFRTLRTNFVDGTADLQHA